jgi:hypothetical protein
LKNSHKHSRKQCSAPVTFWYRFRCGSSDPYLCLRDPAPAGDREVLDKVQEKAVKIVTGLKAVSYKDRYAELGLETLQVRRERLDSRYGPSAQVKRQEKPKTVQDDE